jgi:hypothetical protein
VVRRAARALAPLAPPAAAKARIVETLARERAVATESTRRRRVMLPLAAAAILAIAVTGAVLLMRSTASPPAPAAAASAPAPVDPATATPDELIGSVEAELQQTERHLERAVAGLEALARDRQSLDPQVNAEVQKSMLVIDRAIGESRAAIRNDPLSAEAQDSLFEAFRAKIALLQDTVALINEVRKGNQAEVARIADGMNKS